jgi:hypothetical protein
MRRESRGLRRHPLVSGVVHAVAALAVTLTGAAAQAGYVQRIAEQAKQKGLTSVTVDVNSGGGPALELDAALERGSIYLVSATGRRVDIINAGASIGTWHWRRVQDTLVQRPHDPLRCFVNLENPPEVESSEIGVITPGGTARVEGVDVTIIDQGWAPWRPTAGERFLVLAQFCPPRNVVLAYGRKSLIPVTADGKLLPSAEQARALEGIETVADIRRRLARKSPTALK